jgi:hypothetical protein
MRILLVEESNLWVSRAKEWDVTLAPVIKIDGHYLIPGDSLRQIAGARPAQFDLVIIGNNEGSGMSGARVLDPTMRDRTIIVWDRFTRGVDDVRYREQGILHFTTRILLVDYIQQLV